MGPQSYLDTYNTYKAGTKRITTWLVENAKRCGADPSFLSTTTSTPTTEVEKPSASKAKKAAGKALKHDIPLSQITSLAKTIASSTNPTVELPHSIVSLIKNVIKLRKQVSEFFATVTTSNGSAAAQAADAGHRYFASVLEQVLSILQPAQGSSEPTQEMSDTTDAPLNNLFEALTVEEPSSQESTLTVEATNNTSKHKKPAAQSEYDLEASDMDYIFAIFMFFQDLNKIRDYLRGVWADYRVGKLDVMSAAVTTDTAITLLKHSVEQVQQTIPGASTYPEMVMTLQTYLETFSNLSSAFAEWTCVHASSILTQYETVLEQWGARSMPVMKPGHFGIYEPAKNRSNMSESDQHLEDLILLLELLPEFTKLSRTRLEVPGQDELTTALRKMMDANDLDAMPMHGIFAVQILLDIHHVLREDAARPFLELQATAKHVVDTLDNYFTYARGKSHSAWPALNDEYLRTVRIQAKETALSDMVAKATRAMSRTALPLEPRPYHLLRNHPVLSGLLVFRLNMMLNDGGINLCNGWGSVLHPAHLYNAARNSGELKGKWDDIEYLLSIHSPSRVFVGAPPTDPQDYLKRFSLALGVSATNFARNSRSVGASRIATSKTGPRGLKVTSPVKDIFRDRYVHDKTATLSTSNIVAMLAVAAKAERTTQPSVDMNQFSRKMIVQKQFTTLQLLSAVREGVASEQLHLLFDYFGQHQRGYNLLRQVDTQLHATLAKYFGSGYITNESELPYVVGNIFDVVGGSSRTAERVGLGNETSSRMLLEASEVLAEFLKDGNGSRGMVTARAGSCALVDA